MRRRYVVTALLSSTLATASCARDETERELQQLAASTYSLPEDPEAWDDEAEEDAWAEAAPEPDAQASEPDGGETEEPTWTEPASWTEPEVAPQPEAEAEAEPQPEADEPTWAEPDAEAPAWTEPDAEEPAWTDPEAEEPAWSEPEGSEPELADPVAENPAVQPDTTDPLQPIDPTIDTDGDALPDWIEVHGFERDGRTLDLPALGADPNRKDIFLEIDYYPGHRPSDTAIEMVKRAFANAPVENPDGSTGITLHVEISDAIAAADTQAEIDYRTEVDFIRGKYSDSIRDIAFHYALFARKLVGSFSSGIAPVPGTWLLVTLGEPNDSDMIVAGTLMHELGHNLGLWHTGTKNLSAFTPNYMSVMSYHYQFVGVPFDGVDQVDYSRISIAALDEWSLSERDALVPLGTTTEADLARYSNPRICPQQFGTPPAEQCSGEVRLSGNLSQNLDFNRDGRIAEGLVAANLDGFEPHTTMPALDEDWANLTYHGKHVIGNTSRQVRRDIVTEDVITCADVPNEHF